MTAWIPLLVLSFWPLSQVTGITGSFMEYRNHHLHAGFDLSTGGRIGLPVRCFDDGEIVLIKVQKRGYGRVLYVRHARRRLLSVYGHLNRFLPAAERWVVRERKRRGTRYPGTIIPSHPIPVVKGQVIAWTGETGVGWPHLHFELRNDQNEPVNPARYGFQVGPDHVPPTFQALHIYPESITTRIQQRCRSVHLRAKRKGTHTYTIQPEPLVISGNVRMSASITDSNNGNGALGVRMLQVIINGTPGYRFTADRFSFDHYNQSAAVFDLGYTRLTPSQYAYNLFKIPGSALAAQQETGAAFQPGNNTVEIQAVDFAGNRSTLRFQVRWRPSGKRPNDANHGFLGRELTPSPDGSLPDQVMIHGHRWLVHRYGPAGTTWSVGNDTVTATGFNTNPRLLYVRPAPFPPPAARLVPIDGTAFVLAPGLLFLSDLTLRGPVDRRDRTAGWYRYDQAKREWKYLDSTWKSKQHDDPTRGHWVAHDFRPGIYGMLADHAPPVIVGNPQIHRDRTIWEIRDKGKGVDDSRILLSSGKQTWHMEYDPDRKWAWVDAHLPAGQYQVTVTDLAGNRASARGRLKH